MKNTMKKPVAIPVEKLRPFARHPFKVKDDDEMNTLIESIQTQGVLSPLIVRPIDNIPLDDIETAFEGETEALEGCSSLSTPAPPTQYSRCSITQYRAVAIY